MSRLVGRNCNSLNRCTREFPDFSAIVRSPSVPIVWVRYSMCVCVCTIREKNQCTLQGKFVTFNSHWLTENDQTSRAHTQSQALTRPRARARAHHLCDLCAGWKISQTRFDVDVVSARPTKRPQWNWIYELSWPLIEVKLHTRPLFELQ